MNPRRREILEQALRPGAVLAGKYRILSLIGKGGMGAVYAASHVLLGSKVAIKVRGESVSDDSSVTRILNEARALAALESEHVARVTDAGLLTSGEPYIVMEYLDGEDLAGLIARRGRVPVREAVSYVLQALEGLAEAHGRGIVHRDIKPSNLFLARGRRGREIVKVLDFGISKLDRSSIRAAGVVTTGATALGTPAYMSPEQVRTPRLVDAQTDIWSIGVVLYELVSGERPFRADTLGELFASVLERSPRRLSEVVPDCSPAVSDAVARCMAVAPEDRFESVGALAEALAGEVDDGGLRVERIRASLLASVNAVASRDPAGPREAPTNTLALDDRASGGNTRAAWGGSPDAGVPTTPAQRLRRRLLGALVAAALMSFAALLFVMARRLGGAPSTAAAAQTEAQAPIASVSVEHDLAAPRLETAPPDLVSVPAPRVESAPPHIASAVAPAPSSAKPRPMLAGRAATTPAPEATPSADVSAATADAGPTRDLDLLNRH